MATFRLEILTPERRLVAESADSVVFETSDGEMQVLPGHEAMVLPVRPCAARIGSVSGRGVASIAAGFVEISQEKVEFFVDSAEWPNEIDSERAKGALERAESRLGSQGEAWDIARAKAAAARASARLKARDLQRLVPGGNSPSLDS
ncbi:MAG: ATP synthase F1 subunit epsilon [Rectinemataceae bacterium]